MKKRLIKIFILSIILYLFCLLNVSYAVTPTFSYKCSRGTNIKYYINEGEQNVFQQNKHIENACKNWVHTGFGYNPIYMTKVYSSKGTAIDFYTARTSRWNDDNVLAETVHCNGYDNRVNPDSQNWLYSKIYLSLDSLAPNPYYAKIQGTIAHEIGHAFGLKHYNNNPYSIMCQVAYGRKVETVQKEDSDAINQKYN